MTTVTPEEFFRRYELANNDFDVQLIAELYADTFMLGSPQGVQAVKKEDLVKILPRRKDFMKAAGLLSSRVASVEFKVHAGEDALEHAYSGQKRRRSHPPDLSHLYSVWHRRL